MIARPTLLGLLLSLIAGCASDWKIVDGDGDGISPADGDCWDGVEGPEGSGLSGADIYPGAPDTPYDGFDADCAGNDDYDLDGDGYVTEEAFAGLETYAVAGTGTATLSGDCWDDPDVTPEGFTAINGFAQPAAADVNPDAADAWYDAVDANCAADSDFDADGDGYTSSYYADADGTLGEDCFDDAGDDFYSGDFDPAEIYPGATEFCGDDVDNDCDTEIDGDDLDAKAVYWYPDADSDTFGDIDAKEWGGAADEAPDGYAIRVCDDPTTKDAAFVVDNTDCDDGEETTYPEAPEYCDKVDNDCNGTLDDDDAVDAPTFYADTDSDGFGDPKSTTVTCYQPSGYSVDPTDCDDTEALICPGCAELESLSDCMADLDEDGYGDASPGAGVTIGTDCDDDDATSNPGESEVVGNEVDNDCDGGEICYLDDDNDGYVNLSLDTIASSDVDCTDTDEATDAQPQTDCDDDSNTTYPGAASSDSTTSCMKDDDGDSYGDASAPSGVTDGTDCDDTDSSINIAATEIAGDEVDQDCDTEEICYTDADDDGYRPDSTSTTTSSDTDCDDSGEAVSSDPVTDCDDNDATSNPGETEIVGNEVDNDCSGGETCYTDADDDGYVNEDLDTIVSSDADCTDTDEATDADPVDDCDDSDATSYPGAASSDSTTSCMKDDDGDSYGDASAPSGVTDGTDCDDTDSSINIAATEITGDEVDQDCDGGEVCYLDDDDDGYRPDSTSTTVSADEDCDDSNEALSSEPTGDCDDSDATSNPGASEIIGNGVDNDCSGAETCYLDSDDDGYRPDSSSTVASGDDDCTDSGEATNTDPTGDCDDSDATSNPGETEIVGNEVDNDCSGGETCYVDVDGDGYRPDSVTTTSSSDDDCSDSGEASASDPSDDCDDSDATSNPGASEIIGNEVDNDCSGGETCYLDDDNDGYRPDSTSTQVSSDSDCDDNNEATSSEPTGDCDDTDSSINPGATELCDGDDNDCDGTTDEDDAADADTWYLDSDGDGDGDFNTSDVECYQPSGYVANSDDCDDTEPDAYSGAPIVCNDGIADNDCDAIDDAECLIEDMNVASSDVIITGPSGGQMGHVLSAGDITGDGNVDLLIGGYTGDGAYIVEGVIGSDLTLGASGTHAITDSGSDQAGFAASVVGDVDGDGSTDILVGAYNSDATVVNGGVAYLMYGPVTNDRDLTDSADYDVLIDGTISQGRFGSAAIGVGDQDGDGYDDLLISAYSADGNANNSGVVYLLYGGISGSTASDVDDIILDGEDGSDQAGWALSSGDVNGDGDQDMLIGANLADATGSDMGQAYFFASPIASSTDLTLADYVLTGGSDDDMAGDSVAFVDVNDDGYDDLVVGAIGVGSGTADGAVYIYFSSGSAFSGSASLSAASSDVDISGVTSSGGNLGSSVASAGDVNDDGAEDLLLGADKATGSNGAAYLFYGGVAAGAYSISSADVTFSGYSTGRTGTALLGTDLDADGYSDVIFGAYRGDSDAGQVFVNFGVTE